jgi:radical SAM superfamily enzyme YgiQ (UPF0313 family)/2-polyprenyl-3-methyl-5-hydroxy-6-metoxy-1,4-benzoquinol methylase
MNIALLNPMGPKRRFDDANDQLPPLGLLYLAAAVQPRHDVCVLDGELLKQTGPALLERLPFKPALVGIGGTTSQAGEAISLARHARKMFPAARIVAGGTHATILGKDYLRQCEAFDAVVRGPGEAPFAMLAEDRDPATVPQVIVRHGEGFQENPARGKFDLSEPALPARDLVNLHQYPGTSHRLFQQTVIMASRGCPFGCCFCSNAVWGRRWRPRTVGSVVEELKAIATMGFAQVFFQDDTLNANPAWTLELFEAIRKASLGLEYKVEFRANAALVPERLLDAAAACGVREIFYGVESGNDAVREAAGKNLPREEIVRALRLTKERGIATLCAFIVGLPGETAETVRQTIGFAKELDPDAAGFSIATPFPGTPLRKQAIRSGWLVSEDYDALTLGVSVMRTEALSCEEITRLRDGAAREWEAHARSRPGGAEKAIRALEEKSCREALAQAVVRDDGLGQAVISARLARIRMDSGDNAEAIQLSVAPLGEPALSLYDRAKAAIVLAIALRREGLPREAAAALDQAESIAHPAHREWIERERRELAESGLRTGRAQAIRRALRSSAARKAFSDAGLHGKEYFDFNKNVQGFDPAAKGPWQAAYAGMLDRVFHLRGKRVLDVGTACGSQASAMLDLGFDVQAIEPEEYFVRVSPFENLRGRLHIGRAQDIPFKDEFFDLVHISQVLEHIPAEECLAALSEMRRVAKRGGLLFATLQLSCGGPPPEEDDPTHINYQTRDWWKNMLTQAGWQFAAEFDAALAAQPMQQEYKWNYFVCRKPESEAVIREQGRTTAADGARDYELVIRNVKQLGNELGRRLARERLEKPVLRPAPAHLSSKLCTQADIESDWCGFWRREIKWPPVYHRLLWERAYVSEALYAAGQLQLGRQGLGFGCGEEPLPSLFAKYGAAITATDLPPDDAHARGWVNSEQHASNLQKILQCEVCPDETALARIALRFVDMNAIPGDLDGKFDFCWSVHALEHLGSIAQGLAFIENSLRSLRPGGVAVHTTEFNLENGPTLDHGGTVLFQRAHLEALADRLASQGHQVAPFDFSTGDGALDGFFDLPPWRRSGLSFSDQNAHLKRSVEGYPCASAGIIIRKHGTEVA